MVHNNVGVHCLTSTYGLRNYSVPLFNKEGLGEILLDKSPTIPLFQRGGDNYRATC